MRNLSITGSSAATGGIYDRVRIIGEGTIDGDVECNEMKCIGTLEMDGRLKSNRATVVGTCSFTGDVQTNSMKVSGTAVIGGNARFKELRCSGTVEAKGSVYGERMELKGQLNTHGNCEAEVFIVRGIFEIGGLLNAGTLDMKLYRDCQATEIGGGNIKVRKASTLNPLNFFFKPSSYAQLSASVIEGDEVYLENTKADIVRGNRITIGKGCEIGTVEYKEDFKQLKGAVVSGKRKI